MDETTETPVEATVPAPTSSPTPESQEEESIQQSLPHGSNGRRLFTLNCLGVRCHCLLHADWGKRTIRCLFFVFVLVFIWRQLHAIMIPTDPFGSLYRFGSIEPLPAVTSARRQLVGSRHRLLRKIESERFFETASADDLDGKDSQVDSYSSKASRARPFYTIIREALSGKSIKAEYSNKRSRHISRDYSVQSTFFLSLPRVGTPVRVYSVPQPTDTPHLEGTVAEVDNVTGFVAVDLGRGTSALKTDLRHIQFFPPVGAPVQLRGLSMTQAPRGRLHRVESAGSHWYCEVSLDNADSHEQKFVRATPENLITLPAPGALVSRQGSPGVVTSVDEVKFLAWVRFNDGTLLPVPPEELVLILVR